LLSLSIFWLATIFLLVIATLFILPPILSQVPKDTRIHAGYERDTERDTR
jgi:hypothetical protein